MEPHREGQSKALVPGDTPKPKRFRIIKLEERMAPSQRGNGPTNGRCTLTYHTACTCGCGY